MAHSDINKIAFHAKNLTTFVYDGHMIPLDPSESQQLRQANVYFKDLTLDDAMTVLPRVLPHVEHLNLGACMPLKMLRSPEDMIKFSHLKHLKLMLHVYEVYVDDLLSLSSFSESRPFAGKFRYASCAQWHAII